MVHDFSVCERQGQMASFALSKCIEQIIQKEQCRDVPKRQGEITCISNLAFMESSKIQVVNERGEISTQELGYFAINKYLQTHSQFS